MRSLLLSFLCISICGNLYGQSGPKTKAVTHNTLPNNENIYTIRKHFLEQELHNPAEEEDNDNDNDLARFNRWFRQAEIRCYPTGNMPRPDVLVTARQQTKAAAAKRTALKTTAISPWVPVGPSKVPTNFNGIGRINCIIIDPVDTNTLYIGSACGGVFISHDGGTTWTSNSDDFPSISIADIAVNPHHTDTIYAATGDGYGYENGSSYNIFWGGLYSAGVMRSTDGGHTWDTTGLSFLQTNRNIIQKLLIHPNNPNILLAATRTGMLRTTDAGATWTNVDAGHIYSMAFKPFGPDTIYSINGVNVRVSYDAGATWSTLTSGITGAADRSTLATSPVTPDGIWVLTSANVLKWSHNAGATWTTPTGNANAVANFYGYYDRVLAVSPADSNTVLAFGMEMAITQDAGTTWGLLDSNGVVHVDNHAVAINPLHPNTIYSGNDGGIAVTYNGGKNWRNLGNGLMISQIYRITTSNQNPYIMLCGLQDNGTFSFDSTNWLEVTGGDGMDCAISPINDFVQISSYQNGNFLMSNDQGHTFANISVSSEVGDWTSPVAFDPLNDMNIYFGLKNIYATHDQGASFFQLTTTTPFASGAKSLVVAPSDPNVIYAADYTRIFRTTDGGATWTNVTGVLPSATLAISRLAVDYRDPMRLYVTFSGYAPGKKVYTSATGGGGSSWVNISNDLPSLPVDCIALDSTTPGAIFVGTDIGVYYTDSSLTSWIPYSTGLPNVIIDDIDINYNAYKVRAATYGRGVWEANLKKDKPSGVSNIVKNNGPFVLAYPNPTTAAWKLKFTRGKPAGYTVRVSDQQGRTVQEIKDAEQIDASPLAAGVYTIEVNDGDKTYTLRGVRK